MPSRKAMMIVILSGLAGFGAVAGTLAAQGDRPPGIQQARGEHGGWFGGHRRGAGGHFGRLCDDARRTEWLDDRLALVGSFATFTPEQTAAWTGFTDALRAGSTRIGEVCRTDQAAGPADNAPERLDRAERLMTAGLEILRELRPAFTSFYGTLNEEQQVALDRLTADWRRRH